MPLREGGYARGVVARLNGKGEVFAYFFGPKLLSEDELMIDKLLKSSESIMQARFGDLGLLDNEWKILGQLADWNKDEWKLPLFIRREDNESKGLVCTYSDKLSILSELQIDMTTISPNDFLEDTLMGYGVVEILLTRLLKA